MNSAINMHAKSSGKYSIELTWEMEVSVMSTYFADTEMSLE